MCREVATRGGPILETIGTRYQPMLVAVLPDGAIYRGVIKVAFLSIRLAHEIMIWRLALKMAIKSYLHGENMAFFKNSIDFFFFFLT